MKQTAKAAHRIVRGAMSIRTFRRLILGLAFLTARTRHAAYRTLVLVLLGQLALVLPGQLVLVLLGQLVLVLLGRAAPR